MRNGASVFLIKTAEHFEWGNGADGRTAGADWASLAASAVGWTPGGFEASPAVVRVAGCAGEVEEAGGEGFACLYVNEISTKNGRMKLIDIPKIEDF